MLLPPPVLAASPGPPFLSCCCWLPPPVFPSFLFVLWLSLPASLPVCVLVSLSLFCLASCYVCWFCSCLVWCCWSALPVLLLVWWAVLVASLLSEDCRGPPAPTSHTPATVTSSLPSHLEVDLSLNSFVAFCLSWLSCRLVPLARLSCFERGAGSSRPEPWTRLHCSELHWRRCPRGSVGSRLPVVVRFPAGPRVSLKW